MEPKALRFPISIVRSDRLAHAERTCADTNICLLAVAEAKSIRPSLSEFAGGKRAAFDQRCRCISINCDFVSAAERVLKARTSSHILCRKQSSARLFPLSLSASSSSHMPPSLMEDDESYLVSCTNLSISMARLALALYYKPEALITLPSLRCKANS